MSDPWRYPTAADRGLVGGPMRCRCGRLRPPGEMLDVRTQGLGTTYLCSACVEDAYRKGQVDRVRFLENAGAPAELVVAHAAKLRRGPLSRSGLPRDIWGEILADALNALHGPPGNVESGPPIV